MRRNVRHVLFSIWCYLIVGLYWEMPAQAQKIATYPSRSKHTTTFHPIRLSRLHRSVVLEVKGRKVYQVGGYDRIPSVVATFYEVQGRKRRKLYATELADYTFYVAFGVDLYRHRSSGHYLLSVEAFGGQHGHTQVYYIDPRTFHLRPLFEDIGVIYGNASGLSWGRLVENSPDQYVADEEKPAGFRRRVSNISEYLSRVWTYVPKKKQFLPGKYRWDR
jgi:hypothetical protein